MDKHTADYYRANVEDCVERYESAEMGGLHKHLSRLVRPGYRVLEIGGGSGRDATFLTRLGCAVTYTDACPGMVAAACQRHPELRECARQAAFPLQPADPLFSSRFDLVLCVAVIMHLEDADFRATVSQLARLTARSGCVVLSHSAGRTELTGSRDRLGRLFCERTDQEVIAAFSPLDFMLESQTCENDSLMRDELAWTTQVFRRTDEDGA